MNKELNLKSPTFYERLKGMLSVDFYRLFHTPLFYIFLGIAAIIPALVAMGFSVTDPETGEIIGKKGQAYIVSLKDGNKSKELIVRPDHLKMQE